MRLSTFLSHQHYYSHLRRSLISSVQIRKTSTLPVQSNLLNELTSRPPNIIYDYLSPTSSHLLNITLKDFLPPSCYPSNFTGSSNRLPYARTQSNKPDEIKLPQSHHLVYFPPQIPARDLLPDGTDPLQSPGPPFVRRMWAGGSIVFNSLKTHHLHLDNTRAACIEKIAGVALKGNEGDEKVFVNIERRVGPALTQKGGSAPSEFPDPKQEDRRLLNHYNVDDINDIGEASLVETRNIVFMREKSKAVAKADCEKPVKIVRPSRTPDFDVKILPTPSLLFRFSALTFNAHAIHLDPEYCRTEGYRDLLLHGPLSLVLMISVLRSRLRPGQVIKKFEYRNLAPLYANEELRVCVGKVTDDGQKCEVWIEGKEGGYAVKGSAILGQG